MIQTAKSVMELTALMDDYAALVLTTSRDDRAHIAWMCAKIKAWVEGAAEDGLSRCEVMLKASRWLGFVHGFLYSVDLRSIDKMREESRGIDVLLMDLGPHPDKPLKECVACGVKRTFDQFYHQHGQPAGCCKPCKQKRFAEARRKRGQPLKRVSYIEYGARLCCHCGQWKWCGEFKRSKRSLGGLNAYCGQCSAAKRRTPEVREEQRIAAAGWRERNREKCRASGRLAQYKRIFRQEACKDGTATTDFMVALYATPVCYYCKQETPKEDRTAEHMTPLSRGGVHSAANLVMACDRCNSRKHTLTSEEFIERMKTDDFSKCTRRQRS